MRFFYYDFIAKITRFDRVFFEQMSEEDDVCFYTGLLYQTDSSGTNFSNLLLHFYRKLDLSKTLVLVTKYLNKLLGKKFALSLFYTLRR